MRQVDIYLGFTECHGMCLFCKKGKELIHFKRPEYNKNPEEYQYFYFSDLNSLQEWLALFDFDEITHINISGNEPIEWDGIYNFLKDIRKQKSDARITLRISNTVKITSEIGNSVDIIEMSLYGHNADLHNRMVGNNDAWEIFHENRALIRGYTSIEIHYQVIFLYSNIGAATDILEYLYILSDTHPIKIVYPYFMPKDMLHELIPRSQFLKFLFKNVPKEILKKSILHNFSKIPLLESYFYSVTE